MKNQVIKLLLLVVSVFVIGLVNISAQQEGDSKAVAGGGITVKGDKVMCTINDKTVATYDKSLLVTAGKLKSTDGVYGIRFAHNTDAIVTDLKVEKAK